MSYSDYLNDNYELDPYYADQLKYFDDEVDMANQLGVNMDDMYTRINDPYADDED